MCKLRASKELCYEAWENIIQRNSEVNNTYEYLNWFKSLRKLYSMRNEYDLIRSCLMLLSIRAHGEALEILKSKNIHIVTEAGTDAYLNSIENALNRLKNLTTRIKMAENEIVGLEEENETNEPPSFESMMAEISYHLHYVESADITLAKYNELKKMIRAKLERGNREDNG